MCLNSFIWRKLTSQHLQETIMVKGTTGVKVLRTNIFNINVLNQNNKSNSICLWTPLKYGLGHMLGSFTKCEELSRENVLVLVWWWSNASQTAVTTVTNIWITRHKKITQTYRYLKCLKAFLFISPFPKMYS